MHIVNVAFGITSWMVCEWVIYCWIKLRSTHLRISTLQWIYKLKLTFRSFSWLPRGAQAHKVFSILHQKFVLNTNISEWWWPVKIIVRSRCKNLVLIRSWLKDEKPLKVYLINRVGLVEDSCRHLNQASSKKILWIMESF